MLFMHGGHSGHKHKGGKHHQHSQRDGRGDHSHNSSLQDNNSSSVERMDSYKLNQLEGEIELLKEQNELLQKKVENFSQGVTHKS
jgi:hypothetical protein